MPAFLTPSQTESSTPFADQEHSRSAQNAQLRRERGRAMPPLTEETHLQVRRGLAIGSVDFYIVAIENDNWADDEIGWLFGASTRTEIGRVVHNMWVGLYKHGFVTRADLIESLVDGQLPRLFEECVRTHSNSGYAQTLLRGDRFWEIEWDDVLHKRISGELPIHAPEGAE